MSVTLAHHVGERKLNSYSRDGMKNADISKFPVIETHRTANCSNLLPSNDQTLDKNVMSSMRKGRHASIGVNSRDGFWMGFEKL